MTSPAAADFLTKELFIKNNVVTFRSLSRELGIHVDQAKKCVSILIISVELATFHTDTRSSPSPSFSTYLVSGEVSSLGGHQDEREDGTQDDRMDVDPDEGELKPIMDIAPCTKMILCAETKAQFSRIYSIHVYSLSPSPIHDAGLVCGPTVMVRQADATGGPALSSIVGKIVGAHVKVRYFHVIF
ncbi:hypothetical protein SERLA73DRAFT_53850 [Serpula lacrymans var. lacrymans S7.3]|uniref:Uncharacterized protein n=1 Tax=Serpula lacrymans var. lacrymans (strain S7.3) TaxID=936435 RepID=F8PXM8_SERL3|nr:hypothetical protein SERLA73DRAFT_53850 [Serpula lacrymans var. lacrymans S7.3]